MMDLHDKAEESAERILQMKLGREVARLVGEDEAVKVLLRLAFKAGYRYEEAQRNLFEEETHITTS
jgi:hypothetical protein